MPPGQRAYVVGDIHGRCDLFEALIEAIERHDEAAPGADTSVILLGDLVDRGPDSAGVIRTARALQARRKMRGLKGNHEEMFLESFDDTSVLRQFLKHGGRETVLSYDITRKQFDDADLKDLQKLMRAAIPKGDIAFLDGLEDMIELGDYLFVHAGIDPKRAVSDQRSRELRWIREPFLGHKDHHSHMVVHGHTISEQVEERRNRIGIDTGAYRFGILTALVLDGEQRNYIQAVEDKKGRIGIVTKDRP